MACRQACPYNTLKGCRVKEFGGICPLTNVNAGAKMPLTNADRIRAMTDEELANLINSEFYSQCEWCNGDNPIEVCMSGDCIACIVEWLRQPVKED